MNKLVKSNRRSAANTGERISGRISAMSSLLLSLALSFAFALAQAQTSEGEPPLEENKLGVVIFAVLFFGFCIGIVWYIWKAEKKKKENQKPKE
jgi:hypothetical protein